MIYYINKNPQNDGFYEIHNEDCWRIDQVKEKEYLWTFSSCIWAKNEAKNKFPSISSKIDWCKHCSELCHTR